MIQQIINSIGLILDITGVILIFKFGFPPLLERDSGCYIGDEITQEEKEKDNKYRKYNNYGLYLIGIWFVFQLSAVWIGSFNACPTKGVPANEKKSTTEQIKPTGH